MAKFEVKGNQFYVLDAEGKKTIFNEEGEAVDELKRLVSEDATEPGKTMILHVDTSGESWELSQVPWSKIAAELMKEGK